MCETKRETFLNLFELNIATQRHQCSLRMSPCKLKLDEEKSKHASFGSAKWFWPKIFALFGEGWLKGTANPNTCQRRRV